MGANKWTPGPWVKRNGILEGAGGRCVQVSRVSIGFTGPDDETVANGHLMVAAPELYDALDMQVRNCPSCKGEGMRVDVFDILTKEYPQKTECTRCKPSRLALAKARGQS